MTDTTLPKSDVMDNYKGTKVHCHEVIIYDSHVEVKMPNGLMKAIGLGDFVTTLAKTMNQETTLNTMLLPAGCYVVGQSLTEMKLSCYYPGKIREVEFFPKTDSGSKPRKIKLPFPNVIVSHKLTKKTDHWVHSASKYFATGKSVAELDNKFIWERNHIGQIWVLPMGNIYPEGNLCQGHNVLPKGPFKDNFRGLDWHYAVLYNSSFNNDLQIPSLARGGMYCESWFEQLKEFKTFPYELLLEGKKVTRTHMSTGQELQADNTDWIQAAVGTATERR